MSDANEELVLQQDEGILRLNRPEPLNALSPGMLKRVESEVPRLVSAPRVRATQVEAFQSQDFVDQ
jgi:enoyl-CoA hydratase/carnithine racemase